MGSGDERHLEAAVGMSAILKPASASLRLRIALPVAQQMAFRAIPYFVSLIRLPCYLTLRTRTQVQQMAMSAMSEASLAAAEVARLGAGCVCVWVCVCGWVGAFIIL